MYSARESLCARACVPPPLADSIVQQVLRILLEYQADVNQVNKSNYTSLM